MSEKPTYSELDKTVIGRKLTEDKLRESEERYRTLFETMAQGVVYQDAEGKIISANPSAEKILGLSLDQMQGRTSIDPRWKSIHEDGSDFPGETHPSMVALNTGEEVKDAIMGVFSPQTEGYRWISINAVPQFKEGEDSAYQVYTTFDDITERKEAEEALRESEERYRKVVEDQTEIICRFYPDNTYFMVNDVYARFFGKSKEELIGKKWFPDAHPDDVEMINTKLATMSPSNPVVAIENRVLSGKGNFHWMQFVNRGFYDQAGNLQEIQSVGRDITERKRAEEALRSSEEKFSKVFHSGPMVVAITSLEDGRYIDINDAFERFTGYTRGETVGATSMELDLWVDPIDRDRMVNALTRDGLISNFESRVRSKSGEIRTGIMSAELIKLDDQTRIISTMIDITERKRAEEALRASEETTRTLLNAPADTLMLTDKKGTILAINRTGAQRLGKDVNELVGLSINQYLPEDLARKRLKEGENVVRSGKPLHFEDERDGRYFENSIYPIFGKEGNVSKFAIFTRDISEQKQAEEALVESKEFAESLIAHMNDGFSILDKNGVHLNVNPAFCKMTGYNQDELIGTGPPHPYWPEEESENIEKVFKKTAVGEFQDFEMTFKRKNGVRFPVIVSPSWIKNSDGDVISYYATVKDITQSKHVEAQLQQAKKMEAIATLAGGIAHQFNNALSPIFANLDLLEMDYPDNGNLIRYIESMKKSVHKMAQLTNQLLAYARGGKYQAKIISPSDFVRETLPLIRHTIHPDVDVDTDLPRDILPIKADFTQMQMVLTAVMQNAAEAIDGKGLIKVSSRAEVIGEASDNKHLGLKPGSYISITIEDDGKGMDEETRGRIFEPFFTTKFQGRGLGMAAAYGVVKNHEGWISVDSELGKGTIVRLYLPATEVEVKEWKKPKIVASKGTGTILVIEDEEMVMDVSRSLLERLGYRVLEAKTGKEAVKIAKTFDGDIDLAVLDIVLPDINGKEIYPLIMEARPNLKVLVCSGYSIDGPAQEILDAGAEGFLQKPFTVLTLSEKLMNVMKSK